MKCPKCRANMTRLKDQNNNYYYKCPKCNHIVGKREQDNIKTDKQ